MIPTGFIAAARAAPAAPPAGASVIQITPATFLSLSDPGAGTYTFSNAFANTPVTGNSLVLLTNTYTSGGSPLSAVTIGGATATRVTLVEPSGRATAIELWIATAGGSPNKDITITVPGGGYYPTVAGLECTPLAGSPVDTGTEAYGEGSNNTPTITLLTTTSQADTLVLTQWGPYFGSSDIGSSDATPSDWLEFSYQADSNTYQGGRMEYQVLTSTGTPSATWTKTAGGDWFGYMIALKFA